MRLAQLEQSTIDHIKESDISEEIVSSSQTNLKSLTEDDLPE